MAHVVQPCASYGGPPKGTVLLPGDHGMEDQPSSKTRPHVALASVRSLLRKGHRRACAALRPPPLRTGPVPCKSRCDGQATVGPNQPTVPGPNSRSGGAPTKCTYPVYPRGNEPFLGRSVGGVTRSLGPVFAGPVPGDVPGQPPV